jgi:nucleoside-diphosphate kinase
LERTLVIVKPDGVQRGLTGEVISRLERRGLKVIALKMMHMPTELAERHYDIHRGKSFYEGLIRYITSSPVVVMVVEGTKAVSIVRRTLGATNPADAEPGTIRADYALEIGRNIVHGSDSPETATREINLFFTEDEIYPYSRANDVWIYE